MSSKCVIHTRLQCTVLSTNPRASDITWHRGMNRIGHRLLVFMLWTIWRELTLNPARGNDHYFTYWLLKDQTFLSLLMKLTMWNWTLVGLHLISFYRSVKKLDARNFSRMKSSCSTMCPKVATQYFRLKMKILCRNKKQQMTEIQGKFTCHVASSTKLSGSL